MSCHRPSKRAIQLIERAEAANWLCQRCGVVTYRQHHIRQGKKSESVALCLDCHKDWHVRGCKAMTFEEFMVELR